MKFRKFISTAVSALLIMSASAFPVSAEQYSSGIYTAPFGSRLAVSELSFAGIMPPVSSVDEAAAYMRQCMKERQAEFTVTVPYNGYTDEDDAVKKMLAEAMKETSSGTEGDYLRFGMKGYKYGTAVRGGNITIIYQMFYYTTAEQEKAAEIKINAMVDHFSIYGRTPYETIRAVYDYIAENVTYAEVDPNEEEHDDLSIFSAYGAAVNGVAVCQGYSQLCYRLLKDAGISCRIISGTSRGVRHTWNIVELDGKYYYLDPTWDTELGGSDGAFFMKGTSDFDEFSSKITHIPTYDYEIIFPDYESSEFKSAYPIANSKYIPPRYNKGDVDANGIIDGRDATAVLSAYARASVGKAYPFSKEQLAAADVTGEGMTDGNDASCILTFYAVSSVGKADDIIEFLQNRT